jgi:hypothetical protein
MKLGESKRGAATQFQGAIFRMPEDCEAIIQEYKRVLRPKTRKTVDPIFEQWKTEGDGSMERASAPDRTRSGKCL